MVKEIDGTAATAEYIDREPGTLRWWRHIGAGPASFRLGRRVVYRKTDVDRWIQEQYETTVRGGAA